jgi:hypothetical protein
MSGCLVGTGVFFCYEGVTAAAGAASGALGYSILTTANGWQVAEFTCMSMTQAQTVGAVILGCPIAACVGCVAGIAASESKELDFKGGGGASLSSTAIGGALNGMLGAKILGLITTGTQTGYAAAAGAAGSAVLALSVLGFICVVGGPILCCAANNSGEPVLLQVPAENVVNGEIKSFEGSTLVDPAYIGIKATSLEDFAQQVTNMNNKAKANKPAPAVENRMSRNVLAMS